MLILIFLLKCVDMSYKNIKEGSLVKIDNALGEPSFDVVIKVEYRFTTNKQKVPILYYTALNPNKGFNSYMPKFKLISI